MVCPRCGSENVIFVPGPVATFPPWIPALHPLAIANKFAASCQDCGYSWTWWVINPVGLAVHTLGIVGGVGAGAYLLAKRKP